MNIDANAKKLIKLFNDSHHHAYVVGGCVRNAIMGIDASDTDIAVSCPPDVSVKLLTDAGIKCVETGIKHGTITAVIDATPYEITTFRTESGYADNRHPDSVSFVTNIADDLSRRDFTVNAMAYNDDEGIIDLFGGRQDIKNKIIKTVGDPDKRFLEDALRIIRAIRFSSTLGFTIDDNTKTSILNNKDLIKNVAKERITAEFSKLMQGENIKYLLLNFYEVFNTVFGKKYKKQAYATACEFIDKIPQNFTLRLAFLYLCISECIDLQKSKINAPDLADLNAFLNAFVLSNAQKSSCYATVANCSIEVLDIPSVQRAMYGFGAESVKNALYIQDAVFGTNKKTTLFDSVILNKMPFSISHLDINGNDLIQIGYEGRAIQSILIKLLYAVFDGKVKNERKQLIDYIKNRD